ncbi:MAG: Ni/Fe hydrogenase subunit alpha [Gammaproteobacteria bacterium]
MRNKDIDINIPILARVEGEGALDIKIRHDKISRLHLCIYEPPRLFEKFLEGREPNEVIDAVARICGICPVAYQMSAVQAIEQIFAINAGEWVRRMRRLFYCGEWIESHSLHIHMLAAPDFLGYQSITEMAKDYPELVRRGMTIHSLGNALLSLLGKRAVHPVGACVGGFFAAPPVSAVTAVLKQFKEHIHWAEELVAWAANLPIPDNEQTFVSVALQHPTEYAMNEGRILSDTGLNIAAAEFDDFFRETQSPYSTALHCMLRGQPYLVGPLARMNLNHQLLPTKIKTLLKKYKLQFPSKNMFHSLLARSIEVYFAMLEAITIMEDYALPKQSHVEFIPQAGVGYGCTEAPRGLLWHRYELAANGLVTAARIVPPTSQNQARIEQDLTYSLEKLGLQHSSDELRHYSEIVIRNYDPCISCSTHFLKVNVER